MNDAMNKQPDNEVNPGSETEPVKNNPQDGQNQPDYNNTQNSDTNQQNDNSSYQTDYQNYQNPYLNGQGPQNYQNPYLNGQGYNNYQQPYQNQQGYGGYQQPYQNQQGYNNYQQPWQNQQGYNNYQQPWQNQQGYNNYQQPYWNQPPVMQRPAVKDTFLYILMALTPLSFLVAFLIVKDVFAVMDYESIMNGTYMQLVLSTQNTALSGLSSLLSIAIIVFSILDIVQVNKQNYPIIGLILFTIFCKPGYFLWRAHVLHRPKTQAVLYTVFLVAIYVAYFIWCLSMATNMVFQSMPMT